MDEPPARVMVRIGRIIEDAVAEHERRCHAGVAPSNQRLSEDQVRRALALAADNDDATVAALLDVPLDDLRFAVAMRRRRAYGG